MRHLKESAHQKKVVEFARGLGIMVVKLNPQGQNGWPDLFFAIPGGRPLLVEMKRPGVEPKKLQLHIHALLREAGYNVQTADNHEEGKRIVAAALAAAQKEGEGTGVRREGGQVDSVALSGEGRKVPRRPRSGGAVYVPGSAENFLHSGSPVHSQGKRNVSEGPDPGSAARRTKRVARRGEEVAGVLPPEGHRPPRARQG